MRYGLPDEALAEIQAVFATVPEVDEVVLYGSRAKGNYKNGSDIDLTFKGGGLTLSILNSISLKLDDLYLPYTFDLSIADQIDNAELIAHIERVGVCFYKRGQAA
jgi:uncharacterized protein